MSEATLFEQALNAPEAERPALLERECAGDPDLRARVEALLAAYFSADPAPGSDIARAPTCSPDVRRGR